MKTKMSKTNSTKAIQLVEVGLKARVTKEMKKASQGDKITDLMGRS